MSGFTKCRNGDLREYREYWILVVSEVLPTDKEEVSGWETEKGKKAVVFLVMAFLNLR